MEFKEFFNGLNDKLNYYHSKVIYSHCCCPKELYHNIHEWTKFNEVIDKLTDSKLYIRCEKGFPLDQIFNDYILPSAIFLHYMHVDIDNLDEIDLYVVNEDLYNQYNPNLGGEYTSGVGTLSNENRHVILIKRYNYNNQHNKDTTLTSLFHELTHLVDNYDFMDNFAYDIDYSQRWHEIKAYAISAFFLPFYHGIINPDKMLDIENSLYLVKYNLREISANITTELGRNTLRIDNQLKYNTNHGSNYLMKCTKENIQYYKSMQQINVLQKFLTNMKERLE